MTSWKTCVFGVPGSTVDVFVRLSTELLRYFTHFPRHGGPRILVPLASGTHLVVFCLEDYRKNGFHIGDSFTMFPYASQRLVFTGTCCASVCGVPREGGLQDHEVGVTVESIRSGDPQGSCELHLLHLRPNSLRSVSS